MLKEIKAELIKNPEKIKNVLQHFDYHNIVIHKTYISFGRNKKSSKKSIVINLQNNDFLIVHDYAKNIVLDIFGFIIKQRNVEFTEILNVIKQELKIEDYSTYFYRKGIFGGFYDNIYAQKYPQIQTYDESILNDFPQIYNLRFLKENISLESQKHFGLRYDYDNEGIIIPIRNQIGELIGIKIRLNKDIEDNELKYFYLVPCKMTSTLFGYSQNYDYLVNSTVYVFESEKSVMQCHTYGIYNAVALGSGTISTKQCQMLLELNPKKIILMHDVGYKFEYIKRNIEVLRNYSKWCDVKIGYWDYEIDKYPDKVSPSDLGAKQLKNIMKNEIRLIDKDEVM